MVKMRIRKLLLAGLFVSCAFQASMLGRALATDPVGWTKTTLAGAIGFGEIDLKSHTDKHFAVIETGGLSDVYLVEFTVTPGGHSGWHSHPGVTLLTVNSGVATVYHGDDPNCTPLGYQAGSGFTVEAGDNYIIRNEGSTDLQLFVLFLRRAKPTGSTSQIPAIAPFNNGGAERRTRKEPVSLRRQAKHSPDHLPGASARREDVILHRSLG